MGLLPIKIYNLYKGCRNNITNFFELDTGNALIAYTMHNSKLVLAL